MFILVAFLIFPSGKAYQSSPDSSSPSNHQDLLYFYSSVFFVGFPRPGRDIVSPNFFLYSSIVSSDSLTFVSLGFPPPGPTIRSPHFFLYSSNVSSTSSLTSGFLKNLSFSVFTALPNQPSLLVVSPFSVVLMLIAVYTVPTDRAIG